MMTTVMVVVVVMLVMGAGTDLVLREIQKGDFPCGQRAQLLRSGIVVVTAGVAVVRVVDIAFRTAARTFDTLVQAAAETPILLIDLLKENNNI